MKRGVGVAGDFEAHGAAVARAGAVPVYMRDRAQFGEIDGLILPGTTMLKLLHIDGLYESLREFGEKKPVFGTCAGAILMARDVSNPAQESLGMMDIAVERNAYGRQIDSRVVSIDVGAEFEARVGEGKMEAVFIRAPIIREVRDGVKVLAEYDGDPVLIEQGRHLAATFHPELTQDDRVHRLFLGMG